MPNDVSSKCKEAPFESLPFVGKEGNGRRER